MVPNILGRNYMDLIWVSDIHLNFINKEARKDFYKMLEGNVIVISGDIGESHNVVSLIKEMGSETKLPVYFVLGNHDYYGSSLKEVKKSVRKFGYLSQFNYIPLSEDTTLLGVDGWGDCRNGDYENSRLTMSDWLYIDDLRKGYGQSQEKLKETIQTLSDKDARSLKRKVNKAVKLGYKKVIIVTHVPPFEEACLLAGRKSTPSGLPFFSSKILGDSILPIANKNPEVDFLWLCGHTHSRVTYKPSDNMTVKVAKAEYYFPRVEEVIRVE